MRTNSKFNIAFVLMLFAVSSIAQEEATKTVEDTWTGVEELEVTHRHGLLEIIPHSGNEVRIKARIVVWANDKAEAQTVVDYFDIEDDKFGNRLALQTEFNTKSWEVSAGGRTRLKFKDGNRVSGIRDVQINYQVYVPELSSLSVSNKYDDIEFSQDYNGDLEITLYDADAKTENINGNLTINIKYGEARVASCKDAMLSVYDSRLQIIQADDISLNTKYSEIEIGTCSNVEIDSYDDELEIESVTGEMKINDKYSEYTVGAAGSARVSMYDGKLHLKECGEYYGKSKYTDFKIGQSTSMELESVYDDNFIIGSTGSLLASDSKYSDFDIDELNESLEIESYDDNITIGKVGAGFSEFRIKAKYTDCKIPLDNLPGYKIEATMKYGELKYPEPTTNIVHKEDNSTLEVRGTVGSANATATVEIDAYDSEIRLK